MVDLRNLYNNRRVVDRREQWKLLFSFFESTYFLYVISPIGLLLIYGYIYTWAAHPHWVDVLQLSVIHFLFFLTISSNGLRTYLKYADQLFLVRNTAVMDRLIKRGYRRLILAESLKISVAIIIALPYLVFHLNKMEYLSYIIMIMMFNYFYTLYLYSPLRRKWLILLLFFFYFFAGIHAEFWIPISVASFGLVMYLRTTIHFKNKSFHKWLEIELIKGSGLYRWLLRAASFTMKLNGMEGMKGHSKSSGITMYRLPVKRLLFKNRSQKNVLLESFIKWLYRQPMHWKYFLQIFAINGLLFFVNNVWIITITSLLCCFVVIKILRILWANFLGHSFMKMYKWKDQNIYQAERFTQVTLFMIYLLFLTLATMIKEIV